MRTLAAIVSLLLASCAGDLPFEEDAGAGDAGSPDARPPGVAPPVAGELLLGDGENPVAAGELYRLETAPGEHVALRLAFDPAASGVTLAVDRWDGAAPVEIGATDAGPGLRFLAVVDAGGPRTFFVRVDADAPLAATLTVERTPFVDGVHCEADCARLLQMPLPNDPAVDGYAIGPGTIFRYQFGRRDLVMLVRAAGQRMAADGRAPFVPYDFSQWDGLTPGADTGSLRHASHQRGKDVDLSLYGTDQRAIWRSFCDVLYTDDGRICTDGTRRDFDGATNAAFYALFLESGRVTYAFLDAELIEATGPAAHLQHWPNHDNHIHVRVSEATAPARFEAP